MHPIICKIGPFTVYSYGVMMAIAVLVCSTLLSKDAKRLKIKPEIIFDLVFWVVLFGILGARVFYVLLNLEYFRQNPLEIVMIQNGGLAWQGGLVFGMLAGFFYIRRHALAFRETLDLIAPYVALGHSIGRIGCFLNGCCYGKEVSWGIYFPLYRAHLHPTQLYESASLFLIFLVLRKFKELFRNFLSCSSKGNKACIVVLRNNFPNSKLMKRSSLVNHKRLPILSFLVHT